MPEANDHSGVQGKYNDWQVKPTKDGQFMVVLVAGENGEPLMWSESYKDRRDAETCRERASSGRVLNRFSNLS